MKKVKVKLSEVKAKIGRTNWADLKGISTNKANKKIQPTQKPRG
ncbi:hypothetical protein MNBD_GAMMA17-1436 [hydrothermal vent metagenome]|uniref:Uncharacterized protein n=1 Tax=hydrothermal vent metagenome TaxID=652676 RepID=A0A3B0ZFQ5_9ZZZZ